MKHCKSMPTLPFAPRLMRAESNSPSPASEAWQSNSPSPASEAWQSNSPPPASEARQSNSPSPASEAWQSRKSFMAMLTFALLFAIEISFAQEANIDSLSIKNIMRAADSVRTAPPAAGSNQPAAPAAESKPSKSETSQSVSDYDTSAVIFDRTELAEEMQHLLKRDTTVQGYKNRIRYVEGIIGFARGEQAKKWERTIETLQSYIIEDERRIVKEKPQTAHIALGLYDTEQEQFEVVVQDTANGKSPFLYAGRLNVPASIAVSLDKSASGWSVDLWRLNNPFETESGKVNLAFTRLTAYKNGVPFVAEGNFYYLPKYKEMPGFYNWKEHNDSLLNGTLKARSLDFNYAYTGKAIEDDGKWGFWGWTKFLIVSAAVVSGAVAGYEHYLARDEIRQMDILSKNEPNVNAIRASDGANLHGIWQGKMNSRGDDLKKHEDKRQKFVGVGAGLGGLGLTMIAFGFAF